MRQPALLVAHPRILQQDWSQSGRVGAAGLSVEGRCVAITTTSFVAVIDKTGRELWRWNFSEGNRFIFATRVGCGAEMRLARIRWGRGIPLRVDRPSQRKSD